MYTRKDIILHKTRSPNIKKTDIKSIFSRPYDFKKHGAIFDYRNEYKTTLHSPHLLKKFDNIENYLDEIKSIQKQKNIKPVNNTAELKEKPVHRHRQLVNVGFCETCEKENQEKEKKTENNEKEYANSSEKESEKENKMESEKEIKEVSEKENVKDSEKENVKESEKDTENENVKDSENEIEKENIKESEKEIEKENIKESEKEIEKENIKESEKEIKEVSEKENVKDSEKENVKESEKDTENENVKDSEKENLKVSEKEIEKENIKESEKEIEKENIKENEKEIEKENVKETKKKSEKDNEKENIQDSEMDSEKESEKRSEKESKKMNQKSSEKENEKQKEKENEIENEMSAGFLYCDETLSLSDAYIDTEMQEQDPYTTSDDSKDDDYIPDTDIYSEQSRETIIVDDIEDTNKKSMVSSYSQHCEYEHCIEPAISSCEVCFCLLCPDHFDSQTALAISCIKHHPFSTEKEHNKENDCNIINFSTNTGNHKQRRELMKPVQLKKNNKNKSPEKFEALLCEYINCYQEIHSSCGKCLGLLCYVHFENDFTYVDCKNHRSSFNNKKNKKLLKSNDVKISHLEVKQEKITQLRTIKQDTMEKQENKKNALKSLCIAENSKPNTNKRRISFDCFQTAKDVPLSPRPHKRRNTTDFGVSQTLTTNDLDTTQCLEPTDFGVSQTLTTNDLDTTQCLEPEILEPPKKRKKYATTRLQRKMDAKNKKILERYGVKNACNQKCRKRCTSLFSHEEREQINTTYWNMSWQERHSFVRAHTSLAIPKRKYTQEPKRNPKRTFALKKSDSTRIEVCKIFFITTLGYEKTNDRILYNDFDNLSVDKRGKHQKTPQFDRSLVIEHVESFKPLEHHYRREHAPLRRYLPSDLTITEMHKHFCEKYPDKKVSYEYYRKNIKEMNISFTRLGNEECETCEHYHLHQNETSHDATSQMVADCDDCAEWAKHHEKYKKARKLYSEHRDATEDTSTKYFSADLEKVIMLPRLEAFKSIIFCQRLVVYNETFSPLGKITTKSKPLTVLWHDGIAGRKQNDIISTFYQFLLHNRDVTSLHVWLDNCSAQNKNWLLYEFLVHLINSETIATKEITLYYFEPGHTFMSCDQVHHQVELAMKNKHKLYDFTDFVDTVASINKSQVVVKSMAVEDFLDVPNFISDRRIQNANPRAYLNNMVQVRFVRESYDIKYKNDFDDDNFTVLRFLNEKYLKTPDIMELVFRTEPKGIQSARKADLIKKLTNIVPTHKQLFWKNLPIIAVDENAKKPIKKRSRRD